MELSLAQQEIERRKTAEKERDKVILELQKALSEVKTLRGFLPICAPSLSEGFVPGAFAGAVTVAGAGAAVPVGCAAPEPEKSAPSLRYISPT